MPRKRTDPPEPRGNPEHHWGLLELLAGVRRSLEGKTPPAEQRPHEAPRPAAKAKPPER